VRRLLLFLWLLCLVPVHAQDAGRARLVFFVEPLQPVVLVDTDRAAAALKTYEDWARTAGDAPMPLATMKAIYQKAGKGTAAFKTVAHLISTEKILDKHSVAMAQVRESEIEKLILEIAREKGQRVARSDSGNVTSGMKSDLDQTFYVFEKKVVDGVEAWERVADKDGAFIEDFNKRWKERHGEALSVDAVDVASIEGRNRFPDPRLEVTHGFWNEHRRVAEALRNTPGAYTTAGAVGHQMQFRALAAILDGNVRAYQVYGPDDSGTYRNLGTNKQEAIKTMFGKRPDLRPGFAFDAALANFLELQHYMHSDKFETKYQLRTFEDGLYSLYLAKNKKGRLAKIELTELTEPQRRKRYAQVLQDLFPDADERRLHEVVLEISVKQRLKHKNRLDAPDHKIFDELGKRVYGTEWGKPELRGLHMKGLRSRYRRAASQFCLETAFKTASESFALLVAEDGGKHLDLNRYRKTLKVSKKDWPKTVERLRDAAHVTFLFGIYDLGLVESTKLMNRLREIHGMKRVPYLFGLWLRGQVQGFESIYREPGRYARIYKDALDSNLDLLNDRVQNYVLSEIGYEHKPTLDKIAGETAFAWSGRKFVRNMVYDPGNIDALAQIVRVFFESGGKWNAVRATMADELVMAVPLLGQFVGASRGGVGGVAIMGFAMRFPQVGGVIVLVGLGRTGYAIYDVEKRQPERRNSENAIYRGYVGPEARSYDAAPPRFTSPDDLQSLRDRLNTERPKPAMRTSDMERHSREMEEYEKLEAELLPTIKELEQQVGKTDEERLDAMRNRLAAARPQAPKMRYTYDRKVVAEDLAKHQKRLDEFAKLERELRPQIDALKAKQQAWEAYTYDPAAGGKLTGAGAQLRQRPFRNYLLASIEPVVAFSPHDVVDFRAKQDGLEALERTARNAKSPRAMIAAEAAYREAKLQDERQQRAQRWFTAARGEDARTLTDGMGILELRHKIQRDSLYPALRRLGYDDPEKFVDAWLKGNAAVLAELVSEGLVEPDTGVTWKPAYPRPIPVNTKLSAVAAESVTALKKRLKADYARSKTLFERYEAIERNRAAKSKQDVKKRVAMFEGAAAGLAVERLGDDELLRRLYAAMRDDFDVGPPPPQFKATVYKLKKGYDLAVQIRADPVAYPPPYTTTMRVLLPTEAYAAAQTGRDLLPMTKTRLQELFKQTKKKPTKKDDEQGGFLLLVTATDANKQRIGQSIHFAWEEKEVKEDKTWFARLDHQGEYEVGMPMILKRFPEARKHVKLERKYLERGPLRTQLTVQYIDWNSVAERVEAKNWDSLRFSGVQDYYDVYRGTVRCNGRTQHLYRVRLPRGHRTQLAMPIFSLPDGTHRMEIDLKLENGVRVRTTFPFHVRRKNKSYLQMSREGLAKNRALVAKNGRTWSSLGYLRASLLSHARNMLGEGVGSPLPLVKELLGMTPELRRLGAARSRPVRESQFLSYAHGAGFFCESIGGSAGYTLLRSARDGVDGRRVDEQSNMSHRAYLEQSLARIQLNMGNPAAARRHWQKYLDYNFRRRLPNHRFPKEIDAYWPK